MRHAVAEVSLRFVVLGLSLVASRTASAPTASRPPAPAPAMPDPPAPPPAPCGPGMVLVDGDYCDEVEERCLRERPKPRVGCLEYARPTVCTGAETHLRYCIDDFEYPNEPGQKPAILQSFYDADRACRAAGKRVCGSHEWTLACEGPDRLPFPYGYVRDSAACHIDERSPMIDEDRFYSVDRDREIERIDRREASGARPGCVSPFGVHDLTGNVDEWTANESRVPDKGALKGGNWGEWRNACRPATLGHAAWFRYYQTGFRCCADAAAP